MSDPTDTAPPQDHDRQPDTAAPLHVVGDCESCGGNPDALEQECPASPRKCGHHCNHSWTQDRCHWCGQEWGENDA